MAGEEEGHNLTGLSKYFNSQTKMGRANTAKLTYAVIGVGIMYLILKPKKKPVPEPVKK